MSRYKGRSSAKTVEPDFAHTVEMAVPLGSFGKRNGMDRRIRFSKL
jgi:hypothetical protein